MTYEDWVIENLDLYFKNLEKTRKEMNVMDNCNKVNKLTFLQRIGLMP